MYFQQKLILFITYCLTVLLPYALTYLLNNHSLLTCVFRRRNVNASTQTLPTVDEDANDTALGLDPDGLADPDPKQSVPGSHELVSKEDLESCVEDIIRLILSPELTAERHQSDRPSPESTILRNRRPPYQHQHHHHHLHHCRHHTQPYQRPQQRSGEYR